MCQSRETGSRNAAGKETCTYFARALSSDEAEDVLSYFMSDLGFAGRGHKQLHALFKCIEMMHFNEMELFSPPTVIERVLVFSAHCAWRSVCSGKNLCHRTADLTRLCISEFGD